MRVPNSEWRPFVVTIPKSAVRQGSLLPLPTTVNHQLPSLSLAKSFNDAGHSSGAITDKYIDIERRERHATAKDKLLKQNVKANLK